MLQKLMLLLLITLAITSCNNPVSETVSLTFEKDLIPEGIAVDAKSGKFFLSSLRKNKIVTANNDGSNATDFIASSQYEYQSGFGMTIKGDTLYALSNGLPKQNNSSVLLLLNTKTKQLIAQYKINIPPYAYLNDLAVSMSNEIFITDSESDKIYKVQRPNTNLEVFLDTEEVAHSNGIAISDDNTKLYLASRKGIRVVDVLSKKILNQPNKDYSGIDGMKFYKNSLIGMVEAGVYRYFLNEDGSEIISKRAIILFDKTFKSPTTFDIVGDSIYFIKNVQLDNFNDSTNAIIDTNKLESLVLLKYKID
jgi:sugar lactone lactonase YvrE